MNGLSLLEIECRRFLEFMGMACLGLVALPLVAGTVDCKIVRFADVGWTDIAATTAVAATVVEGLGYRSKTTLLSVPVTYAGMKNGDIDVFLGNWMPTMAADIAPYDKDGSVVTLATNLEGARYTLAVPSYVRDQGVKTFADLAAQRARFKGKIYGIEPGNDGNRLIQKIIDDKAFGLADWKMVESSEQAMLGEVRRALKNKDWVVFLAWAPHPMNRDIPIAYLDGGDAYFGPGGGSSTVHTNVGKVFRERCPELTRLFANIKFTVDQENALMGDILNQGKTPEAAAKAWLKSHSDIAMAWVKDVKAVDGGDGGAALKQAMSR